MGRPPKNTAVLTTEEIRSAFEGTRWEELYPPVLITEQAAELAGVPVGTIHDWSSQGLLDGIAAKRGRRLRFSRDKFVAWLLTQSN